MAHSENTYSSESQLSVHIYSSDKKNRSIRTIFKSIRKEFPAAHALGFRFAERNLKAKYRQSLLGVFWAFLPPLATSLIWIVLNKTNVVKFQDVGVPYPLFVITGTVLWSVFANAMQMPMQTMQANTGILVKINFPREALLVNAFYEIVFNSLISIIIIVIGLLFFQPNLTFQSLLFIPMLAVLIVLGLSLGLLILPISILYKDIQFALPAFLQFAMYLTPVIYAQPLYKGIAKILLLNPVSPVLTSARTWLFGLETVVPLWQIGVVASASVLLLLFGIFLQRITMQILIERMGS